MNRKRTSEQKKKKNGKNERAALYHYWEVYDRSVNREEKSGILDSIRTISLEISLVFSNFVVTTFGFLPFSDFLSDLWK